MLLTYFNKNIMPIENKGNGTGTNFLHLVRKLKRNQQHYHLGTIEKSNSHKTIVDAKKGKLKSNNYATLQITLLADFYKK